MASALLIEEEMRSREQQLRAELIEQIGSQMEQKIALRLYQIAAEQLHRDEERAAAQQRRLVARLEERDERLVERLTKIFGERTNRKKDTDCVDKDGDMDISRSSSSCHSHSHRAQKSNESDGSGADGPTWGS